MSSQKIIEAIDRFLQESNHDKEERVKKIKEIQDFLNYNLRITQLTDKEKTDFVYCIEGYPLSKGQSELLDECTDQRKDHYINMWARSTYFRRCAWLSYLHGETDVKPNLNAV